MKNVVKIIFLVVALGCSYYATTGLNPQAFSEKMIKDFTEYCRKNHFSYAYGKNSEETGFEMSTDKNVSYTITHIPRDPGVIYGNIISDNGGCAISIDGKCYSDIPSNCDFHTTDKGAFCGDTPLAEFTKDKKQINIIIHGDVSSISGSNSVNVTGNVEKISTVNGNVTVSGDISGDVKTVNGNIKAKEIKGNTSTINGNIPEGVGMSEAQQSPTTNDN